MTQQQILEKVIIEAKLKGLSKSTQEEYYTKAKMYQDYYGKPATALGIENIRSYLYYLSEVKNLASGSVNTYNSGLRFLYNVVLDTPVNLNKIPRHKRSRKIPEIFTKEEVQLLFESCDNLRDKCMLMTTYSAGPRISETVSLKVKDIDSKKMQIFISQGKGNKDRFAILSQTNLDILREYWLRYKPREYLFYSRTGNPMTTRSMQNLFMKQLKNTGIDRNLTPHSLRHSFAMHLLEDGTNLFHIKQLLGHADLKSTCFYLRMINVSDLDVKCPLDTLFSKATQMNEIQNIFQQYGEAYRDKQALPVNILKAMRSIEICRTSALGGHVDICDDCGHMRISYNSCRNRHCPKCQTLSKERWINSQKNNLLNVPYFHVVFTIPDTLNTTAFQNQEIVYNILFKAVAETLSELCFDKKYLGATVGFTSILHTWGQNLIHHPHIHCIVPGGGITADGKWKNSRKKFFIPVKVLSRKFRGKFLYLLKQAYIQDKMNFYGDNKCLENSCAFEKFLTIQYQKEWVAYCKPPFKNSHYVIEYLGRYTHRVAISNSRIVSVKDGFVSFKWRDYKDGSRWKVMTLTVDEFIRRFLIHILPHRFMKIRHYGFLGNRNKHTKLKLCKKLTNTKSVVSAKLSTQDLILKLIGVDITKCPACGSSNISHKPCNRSPPELANCI